MNSWYTFAIVALFLMGTQRFLYKVSAERKCNTAWTTFYFMATVALLSSILFIVLGKPVADIQFLLFIAFINGSAFVVGTVTHIEALKHLPASVVYPITRLSIVVVIMFSVLFFKEHLSLYQVIGIILAIAVILMLTRQFNEERTSSRRPKRGFILVFVSLFSGAVASISSKFAAVWTNEIAFMSVSYITATLFSLGLRNKLQTEGAKTNHKDALLIGFIMGLVNFAGFYSFLKALSTGPLSIIASITGMYFVIAVILSALLYGERLTPLKIIGISLTIVSIIMLRF